MTLVHRKRGRKVVSVEDIVIPKPAPNSMVVKLPDALSHMPIPENTKNSKDGSITLDPTHGFSLFSFGGGDPDEKITPVRPTPNGFGDDWFVQDTPVTQEPSEASENPATVKKPWRGGRKRP